jgi:hypothetical protein
MAFRRVSPRHGHHPRRNLRRGLLLEEQRWCGRHVVSNVAAHLRCRLGHDMGA